MEEAWEGAYVFTVKCMHTINDYSPLFSAHGARHRLARVLPRVALQKTGKLQLLAAALSHFSRY